ncbi:MAG: ABC transporter ATP-binding protein [Chitinophagales bacterium]|nr:ABC transporter ATP-binding protein [Chitinophagales bacterium]
MSSPIISAPAIEARNLTFQYSETAGVVFENFNLTIAAGERFGLLGPNGAGKTTLINLITGVLQAQKGSINIFEKNISTQSTEAKRLFGFVPQHHSFYPDLSPVENLDFFGAWAGMNRTAIKQRTEELLNVLGLTTVGNKPVSKFSGGMKSRVNLAIGVIHKPQILFLDEPTTGVDVQSRHAVIQYLKDLNKAGTTLVYTSHLLSEAETLCTRVALLDNGKIMVEDILPNLLQSEPGGLETLFLNLTGKNYRDT